MNTKWDTGNIWLRTTLNFDAVPPMLALRLYHDEGCEVFVNGKQLLARRGYITEHEMIWLSDAERSLFKPGANLIAIHCRQTGGGQGIDLQVLATP